MPLLWIMLVASPFIGSFLGVLALRLPEGRSFVASRSVCDRCGHVLAARDLVPIASFLALRGRCRYCGARIGGFVLFIELAAVLVAGWAGMQISGWVLVATCFLGWTLLLLAIIDWRVQLLPDVLTLPLLAAGLVVTYAVSSETWPDHLIGAVAGFVTLAAIALVYRRLRGREGLGLGDAKLLAALGAWVAWQGLPTVLLWGSMLGLVFALVRSMTGRGLQWSDRIPFGVFLAAGGWLVWLYGPLMPALR
ncbi:MAG TPA: A24 family peptidase [Rhizomicrobium sp.]|jgi:leader peptidase (prepilin peptidase)/N-methyltransferase|nr:A24 family peptidase [Rhizomicrobium sp.]